MPGPHDKVGPWGCYADGKYGKWWTWKHKETGATFSNEHVVAKIQKGKDLTAAVLSTAGELGLDGGPQIQGASTPSEVDQINWTPGPMEVHGDWQWGKHPDKGTVWNKPGTDVIITANEIQHEMEGGVEFQAAAQAAVAKHTPPPGLAKGDPPLVKTHTWYWTNKGWWRGDWAMGGDTQFAKVEGHVTVPIKAETTTDEPPDWQPIHGGHTMSYKPSEQAQGTPPFPGTGWLNLKPLDLWVHKHTGDLIPKHLVDKHKGHELVTTAYLQAAWDEMHETGQQPALLHEEPIWIWTDNGWKMWQTNGKPAGQQGAVKVGMTIKMVRSKTKPTGPPKTTIKTDGYQFVDVDRPMPKSGYIWAGMSWHGVVKKTVPNHIIYKAEYALIGPKKPPMATPKTLRALGVPVLDQGPPVQLLAQAWPNPEAGDALSLAVCFAAATKRAGYQFWFNLPPHKWEQVRAHVHPTIAGIIENGHPDSTAECFDCDAHPFHHLAFHCLHCTYWYCHNHWDPEVKRCTDCSDDMPECPQCEKKVNSCTWYCENESCGKEVCDDCIHEVSWDHASYVCSSCYDDSGDYTISHGGGRRGASDHPPWEDRGIHVTVGDVGKYHAEEKEPTDWKDVWGFDDKQHDPAQIAADFYLLHPLEHSSLAPEVTTDLRVLAEEARFERAKMIRTGDDLFLRYCDMVCGGELRHHRAIGGRVINGHRATAWAGWREVREKVGPQALLDAAKLFHEFGDGGSYGGPAWAQVCEVLHLRETRRISPEVFIDRVFNLEHNGGSILSAKVEWSGFMRQDSNTIKVYIGPAHAAHPARLDILATFASPTALEIWSDTLPILNRVRRTHGLRPIRRLPARHRQPNDRTWSWDIQVANHHNVSLHDVRRARGKARTEEGYVTAKRVVAEKLATKEMRTYEL